MQHFSPRLHLDGSVTFLSILGRTKGRPGVVFAYYLGIFCLGSILRAFRGAKNIFGFLRVELWRSSLS